MSQLMRLRVPRGWAVMDNKFYDVSPVPATHSDSHIDNWDEGFIEDTLWIQECIFTGVGSGYTLPEFNCFHIDLGWYPDSRIEGQYQARLKWCSDDELRCVDVFENKDRFEVRDKIEFWMEDVKLHYERYKSMPPREQF
jgi:hypothetical protein